MKEGFKDTGAVEVPGFEFKQQILQIPPHFHIPAKGVFRYNKMPNE